MTINNHRLCLSDLTKLLTEVKTGVIITLIKLPQGDFVVTVPKTKQELIEEQFPDLKGQGISLTDAAKKYKVPRETIQKWVYRSNYINFTDEESYPKLIDEAELALCAEIYNQRLATGLTGIPYFDNSDHIIEELKHPDLSEYRRKRAA